MENGCRRVRTDRVSTFDELCRKISSIIVIQNEDNLCLARTIVVSMAYSNKDQNRDKAKDFKRIKDLRVRLLRQKALEIAIEQALAFVMVVV